MTKCYECEKGTLAKKQVEYKQYGISIGKYPAEVCDRCGEVFFDEAAVAQIEEKIKSLNLWGLRQKVKVGTSGNALDLKLYKRLVDFYNIQKDQMVEITPVDSSRFEVSLA